ncbi:MAG: VCBS repeat-containing protein [Planctomycetota bacterium]
MLSRFPFGSIVLIALVVTSCGSHSTGSPANVGPTNLEEALRQLGVDTKRTARTSNEGVQLPETYAPLGSTVTLTTLESGEVVLGSAKELVLAGFSLQHQNAFITAIDNFRTPQQFNLVAPSVISSFDAEDAPWAREETAGNTAPPSTLRSTAAGDTDGDGIDELAFVHVAGNRVVLNVLDLDAPPAAPRDRILPIPMSLLPIEDVRAAAGDVDGDGRAELLVGLSRSPVPGVATASAVMVFDDASADYRLVTSLDFRSQLAGVSTNLVLEAGNIDYDRADELVVIVNELDLGRGQLQPARAASRYYVVDDEERGFAHLAEDLLFALSSSEAHVAQVADVAIGNFDQDEYGEILLAGVSGLTVFDSCNEASSHRYVAAIYDFDGRSLQRSFAAHTLAEDPIFPSNCSDDGPWTMRFAHASAIDIDGDRSDEIQINQYVFDALPLPGERWESNAIAILPRATLFPAGRTGESVFDRSTAAMTVSDPNGDGREDLVVFRTGNDTLDVYSLVGQDFVRHAALPIELTDPIYGTLDQPVNPIILSMEANLDNEGQTQRLEFVRHVQDFTEPLVLAALAAPPCIRGIGQNVEACSTTWGRFTSRGVGGEHEVTFSAGVSLGISVEYDMGVGFVVNASTRIAAFEAKGTLTREGGTLANESYEVTKSVSFQTGPLEDSVVFTSIPYDFYEYRVSSSNLETPEKRQQFDLIYRIGLPREPVIRIVERDFYNTHTLATALKIDDSVFRHTIGDAASYPTLAQRDSILDARRSQVAALRTECPHCWRLDADDSAFFDEPFRAFNPLQSLPGLYSETVAVGQGGGSTEVSIELSQSNGAGRHAATSAELEVETVILGGLFGFQLGVTGSSSTTLTRGSGTSYVGVVGSIDAKNYVDNQYRFGLFTYLQGDPGSGLEFEVINYWVE